jgi:hypothetical protein
MTVSTFKQPDFTTQDAATYKAAIDAAIKVLGEVGSQFACHQSDPSTPTMTVKVDAGRLLVGNKLVSVAQQTSGTITAPATNPRIDRVVIDSQTGVVSIVAGTEAASPSAPAVTAGKRSVAQIALTVGQTSITDASITDERVMDGQLRGVFVLGASATAVSAGANTTENELASVTVPGGAMGTRGMLRVTSLWTVTNNANAKTPRVRFSGLAGTQYAAPSMASVVSLHDVRVIANRGATNSQVGGNGGTNTYGTTANALITSAVDTTADTTVKLTGQKGVSGDTLTLEMYLVELILP